MTISSRRIIGSCAAVLSLVAAYSPAFAAGESVQIQNVYPTGAINPGSTVSFSAVATGFIDPQYSFTDSFSASGATLGSIDKIGNFTWTPVVYDAGRHTINVIVTDSYNHTSSSTVSILVANNSIMLTNLSPGPIVAAGRPVSFTIVAPGFETPTYAVYDSYFRSTVNSYGVDASGVFSWTPTANELGAHALSVTASDPYGHSAQASETITVIKPIASIQFLKPSVAAVGSDISLAVSAPTFASSTYSVSDFFSGTSTVASSDINASGIFDWRPSASDLGTHTLTVSATDAYGNVASTTATVSVIPASTAANQSLLVATPSIGVATSSAPTTTTRFIFTAYLGIGSRGTAVKELQNRLTALGLYTGPVSGYFGVLTAASVKRFQSAHGLAHVGFVGPATRAALNSD